MSPKAFTPDEKERLYGAKTFLLQHLHQELTVAQLARYAGLGEQRFKDGFQQLFVYTPGQYLQEARLQTAYVLVRHTDKPLKEIALLCGYRRYPNFLTAFKRFTGKTPSRFRDYL